MENCLSHFGGWTGPNVVDKLRPGAVGLGPVLGPWPGGCPGPKPRMCSMSSSKVHNSGQMRVCRDVDATIRKLSKKSTKMDRCSCLRHCVDAAQAGHYVVRAAIS